MRVPCRQHWVLWRMRGGVRRSDPHLAAMLAIFARLTAGEAIDSREQTHVIGQWVRRGMAWLGRIMAATVSSLRACARWALRPVRSAWIMARWRFTLHRMVGRVSRG